MFKFVTFWRKTRKNIRKKEEFFVKGAERILH